MVSRTTGMPFGPHQGEAEPAARADILAGVLGTLVVVAAIGAVRGWNPAVRLAQCQKSATPAATAPSTSAVPHDDSDGHNH